MVTCGLCGRAYEPGGDSCRARQCPLAFSACRISHCPHCGFTAADDTHGLAGWLRRFMGRGTTPTPVPIPAPAPAIARLTDVAAGTRAVLDRIDAEPGITASLTLLGLTPGRTLSLEQRFPAFVVGVEGSEVALERAVAEHVWVRPSL
jgi:Fe2+ transport system protein FeoA